MFVDLKLSANFRGILHYNEIKVEKGAAQCIYAGNFLKDADQLSDHEKNQRFADIAQLSPESQRTGAHIIIRFSPDDKLDNSKMIDISRDYMRGIGFDRHPYLIYRHFDAFAPHVHIVTTNQQSDGVHRRNGDLIPDVTTPLAKPLEKEYGLVRADEKSLCEKHNPEQSIQYGERPTRQAMTLTRFHKGL